MGSITFHGVIVLWNFAPVAAYLVGMLRFGVP